MEATRWAASIWPVPFPTAWARKGWFQQPDHPLRRHERPGSSARLHANLAIVEKEACIEQSKIKRIGKPDILDSRARLCCWIKETVDLGYTKNGEPSLGSKRSEYRNLGRQDRLVSLLLQNLQIINDHNGSNWGVIE